ncbi:MAG: hypothetical protein JWL76_218 [Thermoleophilia bacterium]|nr:hypothetical protein [Thermoleophilia bacterium]
MPPIAVAAAINSTLPDLVKRLTEAAGILAALLYALGMMRLSGELRALHLSTPTVIAGFEHSDILMKGVGVLMSHLSSTLLLVGSIILFASPAALAALNRVLVDRGRRGRIELALTIVGAIGLALVSRWWEGAAYVLIVLVLVVFLDVFNRAATRATALFVLVLGLLFIGVFGSYLHPPPMMHATVLREGTEQVQGRLVGKGTDGEWYIALKDTEDGSGYVLDIIGGSTDEATRVVVEPADDRDYRTLWFQLAGR